MSKSTMSIIQQLTSQLAHPHGNRSSFSDEVGWVVQSLVPAFADACTIDLFESDGSTRRFAKYGSDELAPSSPQSTATRQENSPHVLRVGLSNGMMFLGALELFRLSGNTLFRSDEVMDVKILANQISLKIQNHPTLDDQQPHVAQLGNGRPRQIISVLAHELRNPLRVVRTAVDLLPTDSESHLHIQAILKRQLGLMTHLVDDLLHMSRSADGNMQLEKQPVEIQAIIKTALQSVESTLAARNQTVVTTLPEQPTWSNADPFRISQILINLLSNASKYSGPNDEIQLTVTSDAKMLEIRVIDHGIGIDASDLPTLFNFSSPSNYSLDRAQGSLGIGLGLVRGLVEMHGGSMTAKSDGRGTGSEFIVRLPACEPVVDSQPATPERYPQPTDA